MAQLSSREDQRPSPDALLAAAAREGMGRLKIFLGAAPGVGKTYEMLLEARRKRDEGIDVIVGVVETHGRRETEQLVHGLDIIPRRIVPYKGRVLYEMDLDAILKRRPALVLVDELAHTNAPGSRHPKRYQDVEELLQAGIDVTSTLNVQHVESLNDVVARITRIRVRETVPDRIVDLAHEIEIVDVTPDELIQRLREGKVYVRDQAQRALRHYFSPGNLTALREMALRRTAERVDDQMLSYMQQHGISGPWPASERIVVPIDETAASVRAVRYAKRLADRLRAPWTALYVETPRHHRLGDAERQQVADTLHLADRLDGETVSLPGDSVADEVMTFAGENNITQIVVGHVPRSFWSELVEGSLVREVVRRATGIAVHVVPSEPEKPAPDGAKPPVIRGRPRLKPYLVTTALVVLSTALGHAIGQETALPHVSLVYLAAVMWSAIHYGLWPSAFASLLSVLAYNFFFLPPFYTLIVRDPADVLSLLFFLCVAGLTSSIASRTRQQALAARRQARATGELYAFNRKIVGIADLDDLLWAAAYQIASTLKVDVVFLLPAGDGLEVRSGFPPEDLLADADMAAARWCWDHNAPAGRGADTLPGAKRLFMPLAAARGPVGVVGVSKETAGPFLTADEHRLLDAIASQVTLAIERIGLAEDIEEARVLSKTERLRAALLASVSHDLKTPLATILGTVTSLRAYGPLYDSDTRDEMLVSVQEEAERLSQFVTNLLQMTRLDSGAVDLRLDVHDLDDLIGTSLHKCSHLLTRHRVEVHVEPGLPLLRIDFVLMEQVLVNLLDNAAKYTPPGGTISVAARRRGEQAEIEVRDDGPGIPIEEVDRLFERFFRAAVGDRQPPGTGLGLAICRGLIEAHGGSITAANRADGPGAVFTICLPAGGASAVGLQKAGVQKAGVQEAAGHEA